MVIAVTGALMAALPSGGHAGVAQVSVAQVSPYKARVLYVGVLEYTLPACLRLPDDTVGRRLKIRIACLNRQGRPQRLPEPVRAALTASRISEELV